MLRDTRRDSKHQKIMFETEIRFLILTLILILSLTLILSLILILILIRSSLRSSAHRNSTLSCVTFDVDVRGGARDTHCGRPIRRKSST